MINARFLERKGQGLCGFDVRGHAGQAAHGKDIVCAGISAIAYTAAGALNDLIGPVSVVEKDGYMQVRLPDTFTPQQWETAQVILKTAQIGMKQIELSYRRFVSVLVKEV